MNKKRPEKVDKGKGKQQEPRGSLERNGAGIF